MLSTLNSHNIATELEIHKVWPVMVYEAKCSFGSRLIKVIDYTHVQLQPDWEGPEKVPGKL